MLLNLFCTLLCFILSNAYWFYVMIISMWKIYEENLLKLKTKFLSMAFENALKRILIKTYCVKAKL